jgi:hypothetical protein
VSSEIIVVGSWLAQNFCGRGMEIVREPRENETSPVGSCYRRTDKDTAD